MLRFTSFTQSLRQCRGLQTDILANTSLYLRGEALHKKRGIVLPYFNLKEILENQSRIEEHMKLRNNYVDMNPLREAAPRYLVLKKEITRLGNELESAETKMRKTKDRTILAEIYKTKDILKEVKEEFYKLDRTCAPILLQIPNLPAEKNERIASLCQMYIPPKVFSFEAKSHREIGGSKLQFMNQTLCYLLEDLAGLELTISDLFVLRLENSGRIPISGPDFAVDSIIEGACTGNSIIVQGEDSGGHQMHLVGGSSLESFCSQFLRMDICVDKMAQYTNARYYRVGSEDGGLFTLSQSTRVTAFTGAHKEVFEDLEEMLVLLIDSYKELRLPFRLTYVKPENLNFVEQLRVDVEVYSPYEKTWKRVAHVACHGQFLAKRLTMVARGEPMFTMFAVLADVQKIVSLLLENNQSEDGTYEIPDVIKSPY